MGGCLQLRPGAKVALRSGRQPVPANVRAQVVGVHCKHWTGRRALEPPTQAREAGPARPHGAGARCCCGCQGPVQAGRGEASCPRLAGGRTEGEGSGNRTPAGVLCTRPQRSSYLKGQCGRGHLRGGGGFSGFRRSWHSWSRRRREGLGRDSAAPPPGTRRPDSPGQGWGEVVFSSGA